MSWAFVVVVDDYDDDEEDDDHDDDDDDDDDAKVVGSVTSYNVLPQYYLYIDRHAFVLYL